VTHQWVKERKARLRAGIDSGHLIGPKEAKEALDKLKGGL
jgi:hypothetical protein